MAGIRDDAEEYINSAYGKDIQVNFIKWNQLKIEKYYLRKRPV
tara:strand:- start:113 stop:241 length:129 start_codon:yes stop_codon:yes gene_type:complete